MKWNLNFNLNSIKFRVWMNFLVFAAILMVLVWFLQVFFLNHYYEHMKVKQSTELAVQVASSYSKNRLDSVISMADQVANGDDIYIQVDQGKQTVFPKNGAMDYQYEINQIQPIIRRGLRSDNIQDKNKDAFVTDPITQKEYYVYAIILDSSQNIILYLASPLKPVTSTIQILQNQLVIILIIALILAFIMSFYLSTRIARPITTITRQAQKLAEGQYGITFPTQGEYSEINHLSRTLNVASTELEKTVTLQKDLMANVSHDLRTPLTMIKSYAEMIRDLSGDIPEKREAHLNVIIEESDRLNALVTDMLTLSRMQAGTLKLEITDFDLAESIRSVLSPYRILEKQEGYSIELNCRDPKIMVRGDEDKIKQVISNLLSNAIKYSGEDKKIMIKVRRWGKRVHVEVIDHGVGIKPEELDHIWERYYKTSSNHARSTTGTGLGLSIVKEILSLHNAKFGVESKVGRGTTFWFELMTPEQPAPLPIQPPQKRLRGRVKRSNRQTTPHFPQHHQK